MIRRRRRANWVFFAVLMLVAAGGAAYVVIAASIQAITTPYRFRELAIPRLIDCLVVAWLFWIGSAIGSFLNVVAWRVPRGRGINGLSHCPWCGQRLAARDNWPVFGWLALRGRCRTCRLPISPRYPIVELVVGLCLTWIGWVELYGAMENLPFMREPRRWRGPMTMPTVTWETIGVTVYHIVGVAGAWALGLVRFDGQRLPRTLVAWVMGMVIVPMLVWPVLMIVPWQVIVPADWPSDEFLDAVMRILCGLVAAVVVARALARYVCPTADPKLDPLGRGTERLIDLIALLSVPAVIVGWQATLGLVVVASLAGGMMARWVGLGRDGLAWLAVALPVVLTMQIVWWRSLEDLALWPGAGSPPAVILVAAAAALFVPVCLRPPRQTPRQTLVDTARTVEIPSEEPD